MPSPLIVALYAGPGTGKSTTAAMVFAELKQRGYNAELVTEYAKDLTWERRTHTLTNAPYVTAKQLWRLDRLAGQVEVIVTDTSPLLSLIYGKDLLPEFKAYVLADYRRRRTLDIFLERNPEREYNPLGRSQTEEEAKAIDVQLDEFLRMHGIGKHHVFMHSDSSHVKHIVSLTTAALSR